MVIDNNLANTEIIITYLKEYDEDGARINSIIKRINNNRDMKKPELAASVFIETQCLCQSNPRSINMLENCVKINFIPKLCKVIETHKDNILALTAGLHAILIMCRHDGEDKSTNMDSVIIKFRKHGSKLISAALTSSTIEVTGICLYLMTELRLGSLSAWLKTGNQWSSLHSQIQSDPIKWPHRTNRIMSLVSTHYSHHNSRARYDANQKQLYYAVMFGGEDYDSNEDDEEDSDDGSSDDISDQHGVGPLLATMLDFAVTSQSKDAATNILQTMLTVMSGRGGGSCYRASLAAAGVCEAVGRACELFGGQDVVGARLLLRVLKSLCTDDAAITQQLEDLGVVDWIVRLIEVHGEEMTTQAYETFTSLLANKTSGNIFTVDNLKVLLGVQWSLTMQQCTWRLICTILDFDNSEDDWETCSESLDADSDEIKERDSNHASLAAAGVCEAVGRACELFGGQDVAGARLLLRVLKSLCTDDAVITQQLEDLGVVDWIVRLIKVHGEAVTEQANHAFNVILVHKIELNAAKFLTADHCETFFGNQSSAAIQLCGLSVVSHFGYLKCIDKEAFEEILKSSAVCDVVMRFLKLYEQDECDLALQEVMGAIILLCRFEWCQSQLGLMNATEVLVGYMFKPRWQFDALCALDNLVASHQENLIRLNICLDWSKFCVILGGQACIQTEALVLMDEFSEDMSFYEAMYAGDGAQVIVHILTEHIKAGVDISGGVTILTTLLVTDIFRSRKFVERSWFHDSIDIMRHVISQSDETSLIRDAFLFIENVIEDHDGQLWKYLNAFSLCNDIVLHLKLNDDESSIIEIALRIIFNMCTDEDHQDVAVIEHLLDLGICPLLADIFMNHTGIERACFKAIQAISLNWKDNTGFTKGQLALAACGMCEQVMKTLADETVTQDVLEECLLAVGHLSQDNVDNINILITMKIFEAIVGAMRRFDVANWNAEIAWAYFHAIVSLSKGITGALESRSVSDICTELLGLKEVIEDAERAANGLYALNCVCFKNPAAITSRYQDWTEVVTSLMTRHKDDLDAMDIGLNCIHAFIDSQEQCCEVFFKCDGGQLLTHAMITHGMTRPAIIVTAWEVIDLLARHAKDLWVTKLVECGLCEHLVKLTRLFDSAGDVAKGLACMTLFCSLESSRRKLEEDGVLDMMYDSLEKLSHSHPADYEASAVNLTFLNNFARRDDAHNEIKQEYMPRLLKNVIFLAANVRIVLEHKHAYVEDVMTAVLLLAAVTSSGGMAVCEQLVSLGVCDLIVPTLQQHSADSSDDHCLQVLKTVTRLVQLLVECCPGYKHKFTSQAAAQAMIALTEIHHKSSTHIQEDLLWLTDLCKKRERELGVDDE